MHAFEHFSLEGKDFLVIGGGGGSQQKLLVAEELRWKMNLVILMKLEVIVIPHRGMEILFY